MSPHKDTHGPLPFALLRSGSESSTGYVQFDVQALQRQIEIDLLGNLMSLGRLATQAARHTRSPC